MKIHKRCHYFDEFVRAVDYACQSAEILCTSLTRFEPENLEEMMKNEDGGENSTLTFDSYIPASHSIGTLRDSPDIVMEIRTKSGAYLGTSDTTPDASHLVGRGRVLRPVSVHEASFVRPDGTRGTRTVVQMDDVTPEADRSASE